MTKGELISACLKLMFENDEQIDTDVVSNDLNYKYKTNNILESINRAFIRLEQLNKLPMRSIKIDYDESNDDFSQYDLNFLTNNELIEIEGIYLLEEKSYTVKSVKKIVYMPNNVIALPSLSKGYKYIIYYKSFPIVLKYTDSDIMELPYPEYICGIIPYFVKGDLYEETNANLALLARNMFESYASDMPNVFTNTKNQEINDVYNDWW